MLRGRLGRIWFRCFALGQMLEERRNGVCMNYRFSIKELPASERPYEKCLAKGANALSDAELLAVILRTGTKSMDVLA